MRRGRAKYDGHDSAVLTVAAERVIWEIDCYDRGLNGHSPDRANPAVTTRVLTKVLAKEY